MEYTVLDVIMHIHYRESCFLKIDTMEIVNPFDYLKKYLPENPNEEDYQKLPSLESLHIYPLPSYEFICHKEIMSWYVKEMVEDKEFRKKLFSVIIYMMNLEIFLLIIITLFLKNGAKNVRYLWNLRVKLLSSFCFL